MRSNSVRIFLIGGLIVSVLAAIGGAVWWLLGVGAQGIPLSTTSASEHTPTQEMGRTILIWASLGCLFLAVGSVIVAIRLLYWRKALQGGQTSIVPDQLLADFSRYTDALRELVKNQQLQLEASCKFSEGVSNEVSGIKEAFSVFTKELNKKDAEIDRLRRGADSVVYQKFISRFLRLSYAFEEEIHDLSVAGKDTSALKALHELLEDALLECGVEKFIPAPGASYGNAFGVADNPKIIPTDDQEKHLCIAEVLRPGFVVNTADSRVCLQPAQVSVYRYANLETSA